MSRAVRLIFIALLLALSLDAALAQATPVRLQEHPYFHRVLLQSALGRCG